MVKIIDSFYRRNMLDEEQIIHKLQKMFPYPFGIGDDAAILPFNDQENYVITKDLLVENRHFRLKYFSPQDLAHKAIHINLSDIAAMGAKPLYIFLGISIPHSFSKEYLDQFLEAVGRICHENNLQLIGGDTTASNDVLFISVTAIGVCNKKNIKLRKGAQPGDVICVAGSLGYAYLGLLSLESSPPIPSSFQQYALRPTARLKEGLWFGCHEKVTAMMDISDGLYIDLSKLCNSSHCGAEIEMENLTPSPNQIDACFALGLAPKESMLIGGEDYGLLVTISPELYPSLSEEFLQRFHYPLQKIGKMTTGDKLKLIDNGVEIQPTLHPFTHFGER